MNQTVDERLLTALSGKWEQFFLSRIAQEVTADELVRLTSEFRERRKMERGQLRALCKSLTEIMMEG